MLRILFSGALTAAGMLLAGAAAAQQTVPVLDARPYYRTVVETVPQEVCETRRGGGFLGDRTGAIIGGVAGGYLGSQIGHGRGRKAATVGGALLGTYAGNRYISRPYTACHTERERVEREEVAGYDVIYQHEGRLWRTRTTEHPGDSLPVAPRSR